MSVWQWFTDPANWTGPNGIPTRTLQHIWISFAAMAIAVAVALPLGLLLGHKRKGTVLASNVGNVGRAVPTLGVLIILASIAAIGVGDLAAILALAIFAIPPLLTNTFTGIAGVDDEVRDAAVGMGMGGAAVLWRVELPLAVPLVARESARPLCRWSPRRRWPPWWAPAAWVATWWTASRCRTPL